MDELRKELEAILPKGHPFLMKFSDNRDLVDSYVDGLLKSDTEHEDVVLARLVDAIDDWKRGVRDWVEVEAELEAAREEIIS